MGCPPPPTCPPQTLCPHYCSLPSPIHQGPTGGTGGAIHTTEDQITLAPTCADFWSQAVYAAADRQGVLVDPDYLPVLKLRLEARLKEMDDAAKALREQLDEISEAERALGRETEQ
ncbi:hypothetical protein OG320_26595 [Microbispora sp. NBC_01189]|uniref:hypothetical protein n=1 Tax=Microbispora sp. NBC_01189 TaxID=2903583 RepID=UPI002E0EE8D1|nr:hypothetical protein OG320_26595 [Microbispora sp. NBC_01189]